jgi:bifunctional non-homologous end joining protein LigD
MGLREYHRKRDFRKTPEPRGRRASSHRQLAFLVQKHDASHLHYDFRLELDGVLKSWAVPKGPDLDPSQKRLAMQVEDHPLEYGDFEGTIPQGQYGGGTVMLWDRGTWEPIGDANEGLREGRLKFVLHGEKLKGRWMLVRRGGRKSDPGERHWFLFKERDEFAETGAPITDTEPLSVATGRDLDEIAAQSDRVWGPAGKVPANGRKKKRASSRTGAKRAVPGSKRAADSSAVSPGQSKRAAPAKAQAKRRLSHSTLAKLLAHPAAKRAKLPTSQSVELATLAKEAPAGNDWLHEIKLDGYRMLCRVDKAQARFISRNGHDWTKKFPELAQAVGDLPIEQAMLDGEVVAVDPDGVTRFQALQNIFQTGRTRDLVYYVFDILHLDGRDVTGLPLERRKEILKAVVDGSPQASPIRYCDHIVGTGPDVFAQACRMHLEGIVSKRRESSYRPGRGVGWLKIKCSRREEFVVGGFTPQSGGRTHFGALLVGYYDADKKLIYAGRVGTGFNEKTLASLHDKFAKLRQNQSPFANLSGTTGQARGVHWLKPLLVAEVEFSNWTFDQLLRHPSFQGLREDKPAIEIVRDEPISPSEVRALQNQKSSQRRRNGRKKAEAAARAVARHTGRASADAEVVAGVLLSHPDKMLYPEEGITKLDLAKYYAQVAGWMLPHVANRPLALVRCPEGVARPCFFQKHPSPGAFKQLRKVDVSAGATPEYHLVIDDEAGLIALVQMGVLEIHVWGSQATRLENPDRLIFDLDPDPSLEWPEVVRAAREVRLVLEELGLTSFLKTTGGKGVHIVVPVQPRLDWDEAQAFCQAVADFVVRAAPDRYVATMSKAARKGKVFVDYLRNGRGATSIAAYSTRSRPGATVSVPIAWDELSSRLRSDHFTITNVPARLAKLKKDPWTEMATTKQSVTKAMRKRLE